MWNQFEQDRNFLKTQYQNPAWEKESGEDPDQLRCRCREIAKEYASPAIAKAKMMAYLLDHGQISINPRDWFQGKLNHGSIITDIRKEWISSVEAGPMKPLLEKHHPATVGGAISGLYDFSHVAPDWDAILHLGVPGLLKRLEMQAKRPHLSKEQQNFYTAGIITYQAFSRYLIRLSQAAKAYEEEFPKMGAVSQALYHLSCSTPKTLLETMELSYLFYYLQTWVEGDNLRTLGQIDRLYFPFYHHDLESGAYTEEELQELIDYFYYEFYAVGAIANSPFCLCGKNADGTAYWNPLSTVLLKEYIKCNVDDPKIHIRYSPELPSAFIRLAISAIIGGTNAIVFMNDSVVIDGLMKLGISREDALRYAPIGCYEPAVSGKEIPCSCAGRINLAKAVEYVMNHGTDAITGEQVFSPWEQPKSYEEFLAQIRCSIAQMVSDTMELINGYEDSYPKMNPSPLLSSTMEECVNRGQDVYEGGAKYNNTSICIFSIADLVDSVVAVKRLIFEEKRLSFSEFSHILQQNWEGAELLRLQCSNHLPKYGNHDPEADAVMQELIAPIPALINGKPNHRGGVYRCGMFSIDWYQGFGAKTGATPNGRRRGEWLSKNLCPSVGKDKNGVTAWINSVTQLDYSQVPNGAVLDVLLHSSAVQGEEGYRAILGILTAFFRQGGMAIQFNILNPTQLKQAQKHPEQYANLQVRLCGWNVYFTHLSKGEQDEFIRRAEHSAQ